MTDRDQLVNHIRSTSTALKGYDFATQKELDSLPVGVGNRIVELEDILSGLSLEADGLLCRMGINREVRRGE